MQEGSTALRVQGAGNGQTPLLLTNIKAPKNGYCYVYLSNESNEHVYFDNFKVTHNRGRIIEENHYYSYGLRIAAISSTKVGDVREGHLENKNLYNDKELIDDADLGWYDYGFRNYDPQIGRFPQLDPLTDDYPYLTPYQYGSCDPITNIDLDGLEGVSSIGANAGARLSGAVLPNIIISTVKKTGQAANAVSKVGGIAKVSLSALNAAGAASGSSFWDKNLDWSGMTSVQKYENQSGDSWLTKGSNFTANIFISGWNGAMGAIDAVGNPQHTLSSLWEGGKDVSNYIETKSAGEMWGDAKTDFKSSVTDPHAWEDAIAGAATLKFFRGPKKASKFIIGSKGNNIALGVREHLDDFAEKVKGSTHKTWGTQDFKTQFLEVINSSANKIHFNLDGIGNPWKAITDGAKGFGKSEHVTSWELYQIYSNPSAMQRTIFYQGGNVVPNPF